MLETDDDEASVDERYDEEEPGLLDKRNEE